MNILKNLFGGGGNKKQDDRGYYVYIKPKACQEIVQVRIDLYNDLSREDQGDGYFVRKAASATRCPFNAEITLSFSKDRRLLDRQVENGEFVEESDWQAYIAAKEGAQ